jgi:DUF2075 family protein
MLVYSGKRNDFLADVKTNNIEGIIEREFERRLFKRPAPNEILSWKNSMQFMFNVLIDPEIPEDAGVSIEYVLPLSSKRVDFILTGRGVDHTEAAIIVELKQWSEVQVTSKDGVVVTRFAHGQTETSHPSYQAWTYAALISDYNETVRDENIQILPCAYLHNLKSGDAVNDPFYREHIDKAPVFISSDAERLAQFFKTHIKYGDTRDIMYRIEHGRIKPSKALADSMVSMLKGNQEFLMIDDQKLVYEAALDLAHRAQSGHKQVLIVEGGPGTGKSVVAVNLLVEFTRRELVAQYVSKNAAPRSVYAAQLAGSMTKTRINNLFKGSGSYIETEPNFFDALIVDEAHRLNEKSGLYGNLGEHQVKEIIAASKFSVFFLDEDQTVTFADVGNRQTITEWATKLGASVSVMSLSSQFRCNGSDAYLAWLDNALQLRETANTTLQSSEYDFRVFDSPVELRAEIERRNRLNNKARLVAGYCWKWKSKKDPKAMDVCIPEYGFEAQWNLSKDGSLWIISAESVHEVGCIHTCQGLEVDYVGVIIGNDFVIRDGVAVTDAGERDSVDKTIKGYKKLLKADPQTALKKADLIIKNTYRTLMTRGQKGCFIFCTDPETNQYFKQLLQNSELITEEQTAPKYEGLPFQVLPFPRVAPYDDAVPVYDLKVAAGDFSDYQSVEDCDWVKLPDHIRVREGYFVAQVVGESMNRRIPSGSWCLFNSHVGGSRDGKIVLVQHRDIQDPDMGGTYTIKQYNSEKCPDAEGVVEQVEIRLKPLTNAYGYSDIVLKRDDASSLRVLGEFLAVL